MRLKHETTTSFNQLKEITQAIQAQKACEQTHANANASEPTQETGLKPKTTTSTKKARLNPIKKAFSERQNTAFRDKTPTSANTRLEAIQEQGLKTKQANQQKGAKQ
ncbi:hypothetical protein [Helicobacter pylori]|uniref:hypothetical protein n=1 Tax=Helicobacter pylori TaxID=210 RepID=UPI000EAF2861|nr:hypothetical protein [Helicobacter pylori]